MRQEANSVSKQILVVAPHGDDEVLGCGGMIARAVANGDEVNVVIMGMGGVHHYHTPDEVSVDLRKSEANAAAAILGISGARLLFPGYEMNLDQLSMRQLVTALDNVLAERIYDECFIPEPSHNRDHTLTHEAALGAFRLGSTTTPRLIATFEGTRAGWGSPLGSGGDLFIDITATLETKVLALGAYESQWREYPHPTSAEGIRRLAALRGMEAGVQYAERFKLLRQVRL